jgi:hypothetical protein
MSVILLSMGLVLCLGGVAAAAQQWYDITFTGVDVWTCSADNALQARYDQAAPRRYATYLPDGNGPRVLQDTTYGINGLVTTGFDAWATDSGFAFDEINLWGAGLTGDWNETLFSVGNSDPGAEGVSSWKVIQSPAGWTSGIVKGNDLWSADATHAFPVWRSGTGLALGVGNLYNPSFVYEFQVLVDPSVLDPDGKLRVFFGGFSDDNQNTGPDNYEVSGVMTLTATAVPEPGTLVLLSLAGLSGLAMVWIRRRRLSG